MKQALSRLLVLAFRLLDWIITKLWRLADWCLEAAERLDPSPIAPTEPGVLGLAADRASDYATRMQKDCDERELTHERLTQNQMLNGRPGQKGEVSYDP